MYAQPIPPGQPVRYSGGSQSNNNHYPQPPYPPNHYNQQYQDVIPPNTNPQSYKGSFHQPNIPLNQSPSLMQPPALNVQQNINTNSQFLGQRQAPMTMSNNQHSQFDMYGQHEQAGWTNEQQIASAFWEQRCMTMLERFQWFFQKFQSLRDDYQVLSQQIQKMDTQQDWHTFQQHHQEFFQKITEMDQQLGAAVSEHQQLMQQKMATDNQIVWEQRYQELLGNFKSLQQQMATVEANGGRTGGGVPVEQYQHLQDQYQELGYQYQQVGKELQRYQSMNIQQEFQRQHNQYQLELQTYKEKLNQLHNQNVQLQHMIVDLQNKKGSQKGQSMVDQSKLEQYVRLIEQKQIQIQNLQRDFRARSVSQASVTHYQTAIQEKQRQNQQLQKLIMQRQDQINKERRKFQNVQEQIGNRLRNDYFHDIKTKEETINDLQSKLRQYERKNRKNSQNSSKVQNLQKKLNYSSQEISSLNNTLKTKNQEITQLRDLVYQNQKLKENELNFKRISEEKDRISDQLKRKINEIDLMHEQIEMLTSKIQEMGNKRQEYSNRNLMVEIEDLNEMIRRNEGEVIKLKNLIELKEDYSQKLQEQTRKINQKYIIIEQTLISERQTWKQIEIKLNNKNNQHQKRIKNLDYQFNLQLKDNLEREISTLRRQNTQKQQTIRKMEEQQIVLSSKLAIFQKQKSNYDRQLYLLRSKQKELQHLNEKQARNMRQLQTNYINKEEELDNTKQIKQTLGNEIHLMKSQTQQYNHLLRSKNKIIQDLQKQITQQLGKGQLTDKLTTENRKLKISLSATQEQLEKYKIQQQSRISLQYHSPQQSHHQENIVIEQLTKENHYLQQQLAKMLSTFTTSRVNSQPTQPKKLQKQNTVSLDLKKRLNQFNSKLQSTISQNQQGKLQHSRSQQLVSFWEQEKKQLIDRYEQQLKQVKKQLRYTQKNSHLSQNSPLSSPKTKVYIEMQADKTKEEVQFYKQKLKELQHRNEALIKINSELREKIDGVLKIKQTTNTTQFYKEQNKLLQNQIQGFKNKLKKVLEENKGFRMEIGTKNSKLTQQYEFKLLELQLQNQDLKRKIAYQQAQKTCAGNDRYNYIPPSRPQNNQEYEVRKSTKRIQVQDNHVPESSKVYGMQEQFQSVLGNLKGSPIHQKQYGHNLSNRYSQSINISSQLESRADDYRSKIQRI